MKQTFTALVERFEAQGGWYYVSVPTKISKPLELLGGHRFGFIAVTAIVGNTSWPTSFMPKGDETHIIALPAKVRSKEKITRGLEIEISFETRVRESKQEVFI